MKRFVKTALCVSLSVAMVCSCTGLVFASEAGEEQAASGINFSAPLAEVQRQDAAFAAKEKAAIAAEFAELPALMERDLAASVPMQEAYNQRMIEYMNQRPVYEFDTQGNAVAVAASASARDYSSGKNKIGTYPVKTGEILASPYNGDTSLKITGHAAIVFTTTVVIESISSGVQFGPNNWDTERKLCYGGRTDNVSDARMADAGHWCNGIRDAGAPYTLNLTLSNTDPKKGFYCSQLVYNGYRHGIGVLISDITTGYLMPMNIFDSPNVYSTYIEYEK